MAAGWPDFAPPSTPYDGHTLGAQIEQVERLTGRPVKRAYVDRGYRGHKLDALTQVFVSHTRGIVSPTIRRELRRRNAIEPVIGHLKSDGLVERNRLLGALVQNCYPGAWATPRWGV